MSETQHIDIDELISWKQTNPEKLSKVNPVLCCLVDGMCDENCVLSMLSGTTHILQEIWNIVTHYWRRLVQNCTADGSHDDVFLQQLTGEVEFPQASNICINMMPFIMERTFEKCKLPEYLRCYWDELIDTEYCEGYAIYKLIPNSEIGKIGFLTIHEGYVEEGRMHQRGGIHTESPGMFAIEPSEDGKYVYKGRLSNNERSNVVDDGTECRSGLVGNGHSVEILRGCNYKETKLIGGIYMASNVSDSCEVWNCKLEPDENGNEIIGNLGDVEHLREFLQKGEKTKKNRMYWLTDRTPHELLPLETGIYRQYFQLVTSEVSVWFEEYSTKNPQGVVPDPNKTKVVKGSKFGNNRGS